MVAVAIAMVSPACGSSSPSPAASCPSDLPKSCPSPAPSYKAEVAPIIEASCYPCHEPGPGEVAHSDFSTYAGLSAAASAVLDQVYGCDMPPSGSPPLSDSDRVTLLSWLVCDAPDN
jgi:hypothetical protein